MTVGTAFLRLARSAIMIRSFYGGSRCVLVSKCVLVLAVLTGCVFHREYPGDWPHRMVAGSDGCPDVAGMYTGPKSEVSKLDWDRNFQGGVHSDFSKVEVIQLDSKVEIHLFQDDGKEQTRVFSRGERRGYECVDGILRLHYPPDSLGGDNIVTWTWGFGIHKDLAPASDGSLIIEESAIEFAIILFVIPAWARAYYWVRLDPVRQGGEGPAG